MKLFFIFGNQLFPIQHLNSFKNDHIFFMAEDYQLCTYEKHHKNKILLFLSSMRAHAENLKKDILIQESNKQTKNNFFTNKNIVFTGTLNTLSRDEAKHLSKSVGAKILSSVSKNTDYLIIGEKVGSKEEKAKKLKVKILTENEFIKKIKE